MIITELAQEKIAELIVGSQEALIEETLFLRVTVVVEDESINHQTYFDYETREDDTVYNYDGFDLRVDGVSLPYLENSTIDYFPEGQTIGFIINTPE